MNRTQSGFTILELMMTMAILVLIISMAMPSMTGFVQTNRLSGEVRGIVGATALARSEAISRRTRVAVLPRIPSSPVVAADWNTGWQVIEVDSAGAAVGTAFRQSDPFPTGYEMKFFRTATPITPIPSITDLPSLHSLPFLPRGILNLPESVKITLEDDKGNSRIIHMPLSGSAYIR
jgi:prepilin-type N-terminal cleavage/methylation domain-containing protein